MMSAANLTPEVSSRDHVQGRSDAAITLVEYGDYECPYCGQASSIVKELQSAFGDSLRFVFRNLPLSNIHPHALPAAELAEAVGMQGRFWDIHDVLYENQSRLDDQSLRSYAEQVGADVSQVLAAVGSRPVQDRIQEDIDSGIRSGANGTPTFFVNGLRYDGSWEFGPFQVELRRLLPG